MKKRTVFLCSLVTVFIVLTACQGTQEPLTDQDTNIEEENKAGEEKELNESDDPSEGTELREEIGIYNGQVDPHTIEIETADGPTSFQLSDDARKDVEKLKDDDEVIYTYYKKEDQRVIQFIEEYWYHREHHDNEHHMDRHHHKGHMKHYRDERPPHHQERHHRHHHENYWDEQDEKNE